LTTHRGAINRSDNREVDEEPVDRYEAALRRLPDAHSLALRLKDAGVADEVICEYLHIEREGLELLLSLAHEKLNVELDKG
jgi:DNA-directed RNA polymerase specialized sigma24 family protein